MMALLSAHPLAVQTTSVIDVSMKMVGRVCGHAKSEVRTDSVLLSAPLVARGALPVRTVKDADMDYNLKLLLGT
jgi:hypothetical protein